MFTLAIPPPWIPPNEILPFQWYAVSYTSDLIFFNFGALPNILHYILHYRCEMWIKSIIFLIELEFVWFCRCIFVLCWFCAPDRKDSLGPIMHCMEGCRWHWVASCFFNTYQIGKTANRVQLTSYNKKHAHYSMHYTEMKHRSEQQCSGVFWTIEYYKNTEQPSAVQSNVWTGFAT